MPRPQGNLSASMSSRLYKVHLYLNLTLFWIRGEQIHPRHIKLCAVSRFDVQTTSNLLTTKTNMSFICVSNFRSLNWISTEIRWSYFAAISHGLEVMIYFHEIIFNLDWPPLVTTWPMEADQNLKFHKNHVYLLNLVRLAAK